MEQRKFIAPATVAIFLLTYWMPLAVDLGLIGLTLGATAALLLSPESNQSTWPWPDLWVLTFAVSLVLSIFSSGHIQLSLLLSSPFIPAMLIYLLLSRFVTDRQGIYLILFGLSIGAGLIAVAVLVSSLKHLDDPVMLIKSLSISTMVVPNDILLLAICAPLILASMLTVKKTHLMGFSTLLAILCLTASAVVSSRTALFASILGIAIVVIFQNWRQIWIYIISIAAGLLILDGGRGFPLFQKFSQPPLCDPRLPLWAAAAQLWLEKPLVGYGVHNYRELYRAHIETLLLPACSLSDGRLTPWPHNLFLETLSSQGILGALPLAALLIWGFNRSFQTTCRAGSPDRPLAIGLLGAFTAFIFASLLELTFIRYWVVIMLATLIGLAATLKKPPPCFTGA